MMVKIGRARAHTNIALIKYWGKRDERLVLPMNSSLSLTLDSLYTETEVVFNRDVDMDYFYLDGKIQDVESTNRVSRFLDLFRNAADMGEFAIVKSKNYVPTGAGLASSASGFAALAAAANIASGLNLDDRELSIYARQGSGSATRSIYGGFVEWRKGIDCWDSYAVAIDDGKWDIGMVIVIVNPREKRISSREGMKRTLHTSPFYGSWVESAKEDLRNIKIAIEERDIESIGRIAESNSFKMHATMLGANPPLLYWEPETIEVMEIVHELREQGLPCYFTMDAGPNVKILCRLSDAERIRSSLEQVFKPEQIIVAGSGPGIAIL